MLLMKVRAIFLSKQDSFAVLCSVPYLGFLCLQVLGPNSGWQSVSLTEIVTTSAVKKAYRRATLHVHPDKLQQRGATIQQKYICEKVFDLLKVCTWSHDQIWRMEVSISIFSCKYCILTTL